MKAGKFLTSQVSGEYRFSPETLEGAMMVVVVTKPLPRGRIVKFRKCTQNTTWVTSMYQPTNAHIISHKTLLKHLKTLRHISILSDHHQGALSLAKVILQYSQFKSYLQTRCCGSISRSVGMCCGAVARCASFHAHLATAPQHNMICCHNNSFANTIWTVNTVI